MNRERPIRWFDCGLLALAAWCLLLLVGVRLRLDLGFARITCVGVKNPLAFLLALYAAKHAYIRFSRPRPARGNVFHFEREIPFLVFFLSALSFFTLTKKQIVSAITPPGEQCRFLTGDEPSYMLMCRSIVMDGDVNLWNDSMERRGADFGCPRAGPHKAIVDREGRRIYSIHTVGLPLLLAPFFALAVATGLAPRFVCAAALSLLTAGGMALICRLAGRGGVPGHIRAGVAVLLAVTCPLMVYSHQIYPETAGMLLIVTAYLLVLRPASAVRPAGAGAFAVAAAVGLCAAYLPWLHMRYAVFSAGLLAAFAFQRRRRLAAVALAAVPSLVSAALVAHFYTKWYGSPWPNAPYAVQGWSSTLELSPARFARCLAGIAVDSGSGLLAWSPYFAFVPAGVIFALRGNRGETLLLLAPAACYAALLATWHHWWGGFCPPGRLLVPLMPLLALWTAAFLTHNRKPELTVLFGILAALAFFLITRAAYGDFTLLYHKKSILETAPLFGSDVFARFFTPRVFFNENHPMLYAAAYLLIVALLNLYALVPRNGGRTPAVAQ